MMPVTTCTLDCPDRCSVLCRTEGGEVAFRGDPAHPFTAGLICRKIRKYPKRLRSPHRIREPWVRRGEIWRPASWPAALDVVSEAALRALAEDPASILLVRGAGSMGLSKAFADHLFASLGASGTRGSLCDAAGISAIVEDAGRLEMNDPRQVARADRIVLWGKNPRASSIHTAEQVLSARRRRGVPVLAVTPDPSSVRGLADRVIRVRPGCDRFLALAAAKLLLASSPRTTPWRLASNREAFEALTASWPMERLLDACGVCTEDALALAETYAGTPKVATLVGWGVQRHARGGENVRAIHALAFLAGSLGIEGGGLYYNVPSSRHVSPPPPPRPWARRLSLPALPRELEAARPPVRFAWITCSNLLNQGPDAKALGEALGRVETVVSVEAFWTETARRATVVLPPLLWLEEEDVAGSYWHNGIGAVRRVLEAPEGCRSDFEILQEFAARLGVEPPFRTLEDWLAACLPPDGPSLAGLRDRGWAVLPWPEVAWRDGFGHPDGCFRLLDRLSPEPDVDPHHPLVFLTLVTADALHSQMLPEDQARPLRVRLHPGTARALSLTAASAVRIVSATGEVEAEVELDAELHPEAAACPRGGWISLGLGVNEATTLTLTDLGEGAAYYATRVRLERGAPPQ